ncbi:MAG: thioredoxin-dependent thiol peroxidase [Isosphaeraceae bacterium]
MLEEGQEAPEFTLEDQDGHPVTLLGFRGKPVVLYFYPKDNTDACTREACDFRDARLDELGAVVIGISPDGVASHRKFSAKQALNFPILSDPEAAVCRAYGVWKEKAMYGRKFLGVERTTFLLDLSGKIARIFPRVKVTGHVEAVRQALGKT